MSTLRLVAKLAAMILPVWAADSSVTAFADVTSRHLLHRVTVFSDSPERLQDPRHPQFQAGADKMFAPIGLIQTNHRVPHQVGTFVSMDFDMATAFLVSPCYVLTNYHVVFGNRKSRPEAGRDFSMTFRAGGQKSRAVPVKYGEFYRFDGRDWALLRLEPDGAQACLGEDPDIGWVRLAPLAKAEAASTSLSVAGYPSDKSESTLWRQDVCRLFEKYGDIDNDGVWTTNCPTRPRASGSPIFFIQDGALNVVAIMRGHLGIEAANEILPAWDPNRANLALDIGKILSSDPDFLKLVQSDIDRFDHRVQGSPPQGSPGPDIIP